MNGSRTKEIEKRTCIFQTSELLYTQKRRTNPLEYNTTKDVAAASGPMAMVARLFPLSFLNNSFPSEGNGSERPAAVCSLEIDQVNCLCTGAAISNSEYIKVLESRNFLSRPKR